MSYCCMREPVPLFEPAPAPASAPALPVLNSRRWAAAPVVRLRVVPVVGDCIGLLGGTAVPPVDVEAPRLLVMTDAREANSDLAEAV